MTLDIRNVDPCYIIPRNEDDVPPLVQIGVVPWVAVIERTEPLSRGVAVMWGWNCPDCHLPSCMGARIVGWPFILN